MKEQEDMTIATEAFTQETLIERLTTQELEKLLDDMYKVSKSGFGGTSPWSLTGLKASLDSSNTVLVEARIANRTVGFLIASVSSEELDIYMIVVGADFKRQHIGTKLLEQLIAFGKKRYISAIVLETRESNIAARKLYKSVGFEEVGLRKAYYSSPIEHAVVMRRDLGKEMSDC